MASMTIAWPGIRLKKISTKEFRKLVIDLNELYKANPALYELNFDYKVLNGSIMGIQKIRLSPFTERAKTERPTCLLWVILASMHIDDYEIGSG